jgi:hypothetical protein
LFVHVPSAQPPGAAQSRLHFCVLHGCVRGDAGHAPPPCAGWVVTAYGWLWVPPPQGALQADQAPQPPSQATAYA